MVVGSAMLELLRHLQAGEFRLVVQRLTVDLRQERRHRGGAPGGAGHVLLLVEEGEGELVGIRFGKLERVWELG